MQTVIIIVNLILCAIGLICIRIQIHTKENRTLNVVKQVVIPGAGVGTLVSALVISPIKR